MQELIKLNRRQQRAGVDLRSNPVVSTGSTMATPQPTNVIALGVENFVAVAAAIAARVLEEEDRKTNRHAAPAVTEDQTLLVAA